VNTWINGRSGTKIDCRDRGFQYGDGVFETMRVRRSRIRLLDYHLERLSEGCRRLKIDAPNADSLRREMAARAARQTDAVLKLIVTRGVGSRGYRPGAAQRCTRVLSLHALPRAAGLKTLNRLESVMARGEWRDARIWEGLMRDVDGNVICGTMSNLFLRRGSRLITPILDRCGIAGVMRRWVLEQARRLRLRASQERLAWADLGDADEVFMTNAVAGIVSVAVIEHGGQRVLLKQSNTALRLRARLELM
jgi:4-amino-4-deoxychorismate lyase